MEVINLQNDEYANIVMDLNMINVKIKSLY